MIRLSSLLLAPPVGKRLSERYLDYRQHGASWLSAALGCLWASLAWAFMPLETPRWQAIRERHGEFFPHINPHRPRPLDPIRYLSASCHLTPEYPDGIPFSIGHSLTFPSMRNEEMHGCHLDEKSCSVRLRNYL